MANRFRGEVPIQLDRKRTLRFTTDSLAALDGPLGVDWKTFLFRIADASQALQEKIDEGGELDISEAMDAGAVLSTKDLAALLWAGLRHEDPELTVADAANLIDFAPGDGLIQQESFVGGAVVQSFLLRVAPEAASQAMESKIHSRAKPKRSKPKSDGETNLSPTNSASRAATG